MAHLKILIIVEYNEEFQRAPGLGCLHCGSTAEKRNGKYRTRTKIFMEGSPNGQIVEEADLKKVIYTNLSMLK